MGGTQDASNSGRRRGKNNCRTTTSRLEVAIPSLFRSDLLRSFCHDDFALAVAEQEVERFNPSLKSDATGLIGHASHLDEELEVLNRTVRSVNDKLRRSRQTEACTATTCRPRVKLSAAVRKHKFLPQRKNESSLPWKDRVDIAETVKCLSPAVVHPREIHLAQLHRLARYMKGAPRCVPAEEAALAASDLVTRRSATGVLLRRGSRLLRQG